MSGIAEIQKYFTDGMNCLQDKQQGLSDASWNFEKVVSLCGEMKGEESTQVTEYRFKSSFYLPILYNIYQGSIVPDFETTCSLGVYVNQRYVAWSQLDKKHREAMCGDLATALPTHILARYGEATQKLTTYFAFFPPSAFRGSHSLSRLVLPPLDKLCTCDAV